MAAYPSYAILLGSTQRLESGWNRPVATSGWQSDTQLHAKQYYQFSLLHNLTGTEYDALLATYNDGPRDEYTLTYRTESPAITYTVMFTGVPEIVRNHGGSRFDVRVPLRGYKDPPPPVVLFYDTFTEGDNRILSNHTPDINIPGNPWVERQQSIQIDADTFVNARTWSSGQLAVSTTDLEDSDVIITWDGVGAVAGSAWAWTGVCFRYTDLSNYFYARPVADSGGAWAWHIYENTAHAGDGTSRASDTGITSGEVGLAYSGKVTLSGDDIRFEVVSEGIDISYNTSVRNTVTTHGLAGKYFNATDVVWDNFKVTDNT
jgi:hypothetical protein